MSFARWLGISGFAIAVVVASIAGHAQPGPNMREFMKIKLKHSQDVLAGLVNEDFDKIAKGAQEMSLLSQAASWQVMQTEEYLQQSKEFRRTADALRDAAKAKNIDAAALAYVDATMKCVNCHKYVRGIRMAQAPRNRNAEE